MDITVEQDEFVLDISIVDASDEKFAHLMEATSDGCGSSTQSACVGC
jgi:FxLD family lantipeptide